MFFWSCTTRKPEFWGNWHGSFWRPQLHLKSCQKFKKIMKRFWDIFEKINFYTQNELERGLEAEVEFFSKIQVTFEYLWWINIMQHIKKKLMNCSWEINVKDEWTNGRTNERTNGRTDGQDWNYRTLLLKGPMS